MRNQQECANKKCKAVSTPLWRKGWIVLDDHSGKTMHAILCNACGLRHRKNMFCIYCHQIYKESEATESQTWITCQKCNRCTHIECEKQHGHDPAMLVQCPDCRSNKPVQARTKTSVAETTTTTTTTSIGTSKKRKRIEEEEVDEEKKDTRPSSKRARRSNNKDNNFVSDTSSDEASVVDYDSEDDHVVAADDMWQVQKNLHQVCHLLQENFGKTVQVSVIEQACKKAKLPNSKKLASLVLLCKVLQEI